MLEARQLLALVAWDGGGDGVSWSDARNWDSTLNDHVPGVSDDAVIAISAALAVNLPNTETRVRSLQSTASLAMSGGSLIVTLGTSGIDGRLTIGGGAELTATGSGTSFTARAGTFINDASLYALGGGYLSLPGLTDYAMVAGGTRTLQADGVGSVLDISSATTLTGSSADGSDSVTHTLQVLATNGGKVDLSGTTRIIDPAAGNELNRRFVISSAGTGSVIDLAGLTELRDTTSASYFGSGVSSVGASGGGTVNAPLMTRFANTDLRLGNAASTLLTGQLTSVTNGSITVSGMGNNLVFPSLTDIGGSSMYALGGGHLALPGVTSYSLTQRGIATLMADGPGSVLDLSGVTTMTGSTLDGGFRTLDSIEIRATGGGKVDLSSVTQIIDSSLGNGVGRRTAISAVGAGSRIELPLLTSLLDRDGTFIDASDLGQGVSVVEAIGGGTVNAPLLRSLTHTNVTIADATSVLPVGQFTSIANGSITVSGTGNNRAFTSLTDVTGSSVTANGVTLTLASLTAPRSSSFYALGGGHLALPGVTSYSLTQRGIATLMADGPGSVLDLSGVTTMTGSTLDGGFRTLDSIEIRATGGGKVDLSSVTQIIDSSLGNGVGRRTAISAVGAGSRIELPLLTSLLDRDGTFIDASDLGQGVSVVEAIGGGTVNAPLLRSLTHTNVTIADATSVLPVGQFTSIANGSITVSGTGNNRAFTSLTDVTGSSVTANGGAILGLPGVTSAIFNSANQSWTTTTGGVLDYPALTSIVMSAGLFDIDTTILADTFSWSGGTLSGDGKIVIGAGVNGTISGSTAKILAVTLENAGHLTYSGSGLSFGLANQSGTIINLAGKTFSLVNDGDISVNVATAGNGITNAGSLVRYGTGTTTISIPIANTGSLVIQQGTLELGVGIPLSLPNPAYLSIFAGGFLRLSGALVSSTMNADLFSAVGNVTFGGGTLASPRTIEVMGSRSRSVIQRLRTQFRLWNPLP